MASSDVEHWQCDKTLPQCMAYMLDNQIMCDVTFVLGEERLEVYAHKYMLASRSPVFHAMLDGPMAESGNIEIPDIEKDIFCLLLRYVYTDAVLLTVENVLQVMYASKKYCIDLLTKQCKIFVQKNITNENACVLMDSASLQEEEIFKSCLEKVKHNTEVCIRGPGFSSICRDTLKIITELENVIIQEEVLYEHVMKWCDAECGRQQLEVTWKNKRKLLGDILYDIRFPLMDTKYFAKEIAEHDLLTDKEKVGIMCYHSLGTPRTSSPFNHRERSSGKVEKVIRFPSFNSSVWGLAGGKDAIGFKTSHYSKLYGILLYGSNTSSCNYTVQVVVTDLSGCIHNSTKTEIVSDMKKEMHELKFEKPVNIEAHKKFRVELLMIGSRSNSGKNGMCIVPFASGAKEVTFFHSEPSPNGTSVECGQIPGLLLM